MKHLFTFLFILAFFIIFTNQAQAQRTTIRLKADQTLETITQDPTVTSAGARVSADCSLNLNLVYSTTFCAGEGPLGNKLVGGGSGVSANGECVSGFTVELSDGDGTFTNPIIVGTSASFSFTGLRNVVLPATLPYGTNYKIRIQSTATGIYSNTNGPFTIFPAPAVTLLNSGTLTCASKAVTLTAGGATTYAFSAGATSTGPGSATVSQEGSYTVTGTTNGCSATAVTTVSSNTVAAQNVTLSSSGTLTCSNTSVNLSAGSSTPNVSYVFSGPGVTGQNGATATANQEGMYMVKVTGTNGCTATQSTQVQSNTTAPTATLSNNGPITCNQRTVTLTAGGGGNYGFSNGASQVNGGNTATVTAQGLYSVTVTASNGCTATQTTQVQSNTTAPNATLSNNGPITCTNRTVTLTAGGGGTYAFSSGASANGTTATVTNEGPYSVTVIGTNGCTATQTTQVTSNTTAPSASLSNNGPITCTQRTVTLTAGGGGTYAFSPGATPNGNTATVTNEGPYSVTVLGTNGCTATQSTQVSSNTTAPNATLNHNGPLTANQPTVTLTAGGGNTYAFSSGATQQGGGNTATVTSTGTYQVNVTGTNGCSATASTTVTGAVSGSSCRNGSGVITVVATGNPVKYEWYRNSINSARLTENPAQVRGTSTASLTLVNQQVTADYYVRVTDANGSAVVYGPFRFTVNLGCNIYARTGVEEVELRISLLGNPVQGDQLKAVITGAEGKALNLQLLDLQGRTVRQQAWQQADQSQTIEWSLGDHSSGVYLLQATTPEQRQSLKVVKP